MAACNLNIGFNEPITDLIHKAQTGITSAGGVFQGDLEKGTYTIPTSFGKIVGAYQVHGDHISFEITDKPWIVSCKKIQEELEKYLSKPLA